MQKIPAVIITVLILTACDGSIDSGTQADSELLLPIAESFIDAFYSFDPVRLEGLLVSASDSLPAIAYYQGWAEGAHYKVLGRKSCEAQSSNLVSCSITVEDDPMLALGSDYKVTDTFTLEFANGTISAVETSSDDLQLYYDAGDWVRERLPELIEVPCAGFFAGGPTPGDCARAMTEGYARFAASEDFPKL